MSVVASKNIADLMSNSQDTHLQMQIVQEERDGMREAMENLWNEKASLDEELENSMQAYTNLTESFAQSQDEKCEIESLVERKEQENRESSTALSGVHARKTVFRTHSLRTLCEIAEKMPLFLTKTMRRFPEDTFI